MNRIKKIWDLLGLHLLLILFGAILLLWPSSAVALVTKIMAWILILAGVWNVIKNLMNRIEGVKSWIWAVLYLVVGGYMLANPLTISDLIGRVLGVMLITQGVRDLRKSHQTAGKALGGLTLAAGVILCLMPRTLTNTLLALAGLVLIAIGVINCFSRLRGYRQLEEGSDPNIIDADE